MTERSAWSRMYARTQRAVQHTWLAGEGSRGQGPQGNIGSPRHGHRPIGQWPFLWVDRGTTVPSTVCRRSSDLEIGATKCCKKKILVVVRKERLPRYSLRRRPPSLDGIERRTRTGPSLHAEYLAYSPSFPSAHPSVCDMDDHTQASKEAARG